MTEVDWLLSAEPQKLLRSVWASRKPSERKARLFGVACCRRTWHLLPAAGRAALEAGERYPDGQATVAELREARAALDRLCEHEQVTPGTLAQEAARCSAWLGQPSSRLAVEEVATYWAASYVTHAAAWIGRAAERTERKAQAALVRCLFANPFRPPPLFAPSLLTWGDCLLRRLALTAYDDRQLPEGTLDAARLAVLADALEEAGCNDPAVLEHCRSPGPHVRGCWVVDLLLGKE
jgi:hypothetical protein